LDVGIELDGELERGPKAFDQEQQKSTNQSPDPGARPLLKCVTACIRLMENATNKGLWLAKERLGG
jgi:hypothetical protein